ncbi:ribonuclease Z [Clostridiaceae bacterium]|nr:ribonuclease Z [Lachnospiraceae bacterium]NBH19091.1 ribonuclease Z [Clostridiaceae bacterium]
MLDICLLGTGGMMPLPYRWLTSMMARCEGSSLLIDCGEGTQVALKEKGWSPKPIDIICFTHYHADHISGLPGLLLTMGNAERTEPLTMVGPKGLERVVTALRCIAPELPFPLRFMELEESRQKLRLGPYVIDAYRVNHNVVCYGYGITIPRAGRFDVERAKAANVPMKAWSRLQKGEIVEIDNKRYTPDMVLGPERRGLKVAYCTDTRPVPVIAEYAKDADLFICEGMYGEDGKETKAREYKHMTMYEAASLAQKAEPKELWLTHYSPSLTRPEEYMEKVRKIFPRAKAARDGWSAELTFEEEEESP